MDMMSDGLGLTFSPYSARVCFRNGVLEDADKQDCSRGQNILDFKFCRNVFTSCSSSLRAHTKRMNCADEVPGGNYSIPSPA